MTALYHETVFNDKPRRLSFATMIDLMERETFGDRFARLVDEAGLDARDVCLIVGWKSDSSYYKARRGDLGSMNPMGLLRLAKRLGVSPYYLVGEPEPTGVPGVFYGPRSHGGFTVDEPDALVHVDLRIEPKAGVEVDAQRAADIRMKLVVAIGAKLGRSATWNERDVPPVTPPAASPDMLTRLEELEADAEDRLSVDRKVRALDAALNVLLDAQELPGTLRDRLREALGP